ncbi:hypothetical protein ACV1EH_19785, partial [Aeromonas caviae]
MLGWLDMSWQSTLLMAPFGASCVLLFSLPEALLIKSVAGWPFPNPLIPLNSLAG